MRPDGANAKRVYEALAKFGAPLSAFEVAVEDFAEYGGVLQLGLPPFRIDVINSAPGITFDEAVEESSHLDIEGRAIPVIGNQGAVEEQARLCESIGSCGRRSLVGGCPFHNAVVSSSHAAPLKLPRRKTQ